MLAIHVVSMQYAQRAAGSIERNSLRRGAESASGGVGCRDNDGDRSGVVGCIRVAPMGVHRAPVGSPRRVDASTVASRGGVVVLAPLCGLGAAAASAMAGLALVMAFEPDQKPVGPSEPPPPARTEPTEPERTSEDRASPSASPSTPSPSASPSATPSPSASP